MREKAGGAAASTLIDLPPVCVTVVAVVVGDAVAVLAGGITGVAVVTVSAKVGLAAVSAASTMAGMAGVAAEVGLSVA